MHYLVLPTADCRPWEKKREVSVFFAFSASMFDNFYNESVKQFINIYFGYSDTTSVHQTSLTGG